MFATNEFDITGEVGLGFWGFVWWGGMGGGGCVY